MKTSTAKLIEWAKIVAVALAMVAGVVIFLSLVLDFWWACYYVGIPM